MTLSTPRSGGDKIAPVAKRAATIVSEALTYLKAKREARGDGG